MRLPLICIMMLLCLAGCVRQSTEPLPPNMVEVVRSSPLDLDTPTDIEPTVYVMVREHSGQLPGLEALLERTLKARGYSVSDSPSLAGYILQVNVVFAGVMDPQSARASVPGGYGHVVRTQGEGAAVIITDIILAARNTPKVTRRQNLVIANASNRTKVAHEEVRLAVLIPGEKVTFDRAKEALKQRLSEAVAESFVKVN